MEDVHESLSEDNIIVDGINDFPDSRHDINKKGHVSRIGKGSHNDYSSLGLMLLCFLRVNKLQQSNSFHQPWTRSEWMLFLLHWTLVNNQLSCFWNTADLSFTWISILQLVPNAWNVRVLQTAQLRALVIWLFMESRENSVVSVLMFIRVEFSKLTKFDAIVNFFQSERTYE